MTLEARVKQLFVISVICHSMIRFIYQTSEQPQGCNNTDVYVWNHSPSKVHNHMSNGYFHLFSKTKGRRRRRLPLWLHLHILQERSGSTTTTEFISYLREPSRQHYCLSTLPTTRLKVLSEGFGENWKKETPVI